MSTEYQLVVGTDIGRDALLAHVAAHMDGTVSGDRIEGVDGMSVRFYVPDRYPDEGPDPKEELLEIDDSMRVLFRVNGTPDQWQRCHLDMFTAVVTLLRNNPTLPGALLYNGEHVLVRRRRGEPIRLNEVWRGFLYDEKDPAVAGVERYAHVGPMPNEIL